MGGLINLCFAYLENKCKMQTPTSHTHTHTHTHLHLNLRAFFRLTKMEEDPVRQVSHMISFKARSKGKKKKIEQMSEEKKTKMNSSFTCAITCRYSCLERNGLPHLVNSSVTSQTGE